MAHRTIGREARRFVIRIGCVVVVVDVARGTVRRRPGELAVDMALLARHVNVEPGQRELSGRVVIKLSPQPGGSVVTGDAGGGEDRKSTRLNSSHRCISYAVFCLK